MLDDANKSYYNVLNYEEIKFAPLCNENEKTEAITLDELYGNEGEVKEES